MKLNVTSDKDRHPDDPGHKVFSYDGDTPFNHNLGFSFDDKRYSQQIENTKRKFKKQLHSLAE